MDSFSDAVFSNFHRTLGRKLYATDVDVLEYRAGRGPVAIIEVKQNPKREQSSMKKGQGGALWDLSCLSGLPLYLVTYTGPFEKLAPKREDFEDGWVQVSAQPDQILDMPELWEFFVDPVHAPSSTFCNRWINTKEFKEFLESL